MERRDFLKFFGVSAATASASKVLAGIPEAGPRIALLGAKEGVANRLRAGRHLELGLVTGFHGKEIEESGRIIETVEVEGYYPSPEGGAPVSDTEFSEIEKGEAISLADGPLTFSLNLKPCSGKVYRAIELTTFSDVGGLVTLRIKGVRIA